MTLFSSPSRLVALLILWLLSELVAVRPLAMAQKNSDYAPLDDRFEYLTQYPFIILSDYEVMEAPELSDSLFNAHAMGVRFLVNRTDINRQSDFFKVWRRLLPELRRQGLQLRKLYIRGAASPEGSYANNVRLGQGRTQSLLDIIGHDLAQEKGDTIDTQASSVTEDYQFLVLLMQQAGDADYETVRDIVNSCGGDEEQTKAALRHAQSGRIWSRISQDYFPTLRAARIILWLSRPAPEFPPLPTLAHHTDIQPPYTITQTGPLTPLASLATPQSRDSLLVRIPFLALRTNLIYDLWCQPRLGFVPGINAQLEYYPKRGHLTANAGFTFHNHRRWDEYRFFQIRDADLEGRWYFSPSGVFAGPYLGVNAHASWYGIGFSKTKGWEGEGYGGGMTMGWVWHISRNHRWRFEANLGIGYFYTRHDPYVYGNTLTGEDDGRYYYAYWGNNDDFRRRNHQFMWFGPTQVGLSLKYDLFYRRIQKRGIGVRRTERYVQKGVRP